MSREETKEEGSPEVFFPVCRKNLIKRGLANFLALSFEIKRKF